MYRQGDVLIVPVKTVPDQLDPIERENGYVVIAHGEATGHAHVIKSEGAALFRDPKLMAVFLNVAEEPVALEHEEHATIMLPPGNYRVVRQQEYTAEAIVHVRD
jgi:hypothetical protein